MIYENLSSYSHVNLNLGKLTRSPILPFICTCAAFNMNHYDKTMTEVK